MTGSGVRVQPSSAKTFVVKHRAGEGGRKAPNKRVTLGRFGRITPDQARRIAQETLGKVVALRWERIDLDRRILRVDETKTGEPLELPLTRQLAAVFERRREESSETGEEGWVFPSRTSADGHLKGIGHHHVDISKAAGTRFWFHGLRAAFITVAERDLMLPRPLTKRLVNHARDDDITEGYAADWTVVITPSRKRPTLPHSLRVAGSRPARARLSWLGIRIPFSHSSSTTNGPLSTPLETRHPYPVPPSRARAGDCRRGRNPTRHSSISAPCSPSLSGRMRLGRTTASFAV